MYDSIYKISRTQSMVAECRLGQNVMWGLRWMLGKEGKEKGIIKGHKRIWGDMSINLIMDMVPLLFLFFSNDTF